MDNKDSIGGFVEKIKWLHEVDYGDFKRKVGLYISRLEEAMPKEQRKSVADLLDRLRDDILFITDGNVEVARAKTLATADLMRQRLEIRH